MTGFDWSKLDLSLDGLKRHYQAGDFTPRELMDELRARSAHYRSHNIWIHLLTDQELAPYLQRLENTDPDTLPLYGVPFAIKDNIDLAGIPTTAACPAFAYTPKQSASVVQRLLDAGAIPLGKTNLDQFATGLVGTRSPYGECRNAFNPDYISGGSSAGSAVATALGLVSFALGTDTAGSGRVPAAFNNLVGVKPTRGLLSTNGIVPACRSLDCVSLFALNTDDAAALLQVTEGRDTKDPYSRANPDNNHARYYGTWERPFRFGVPRPEQRLFFGDQDAERLFEAAINRLEGLGGEAVELDFSPLLDAARLLYEGPWVAERYLAAGSLLNEFPEQVLPVIRQIIEPGQEPKATDAFSAQYRLQALKQQADELVAQVDCLLSPTAPTCYLRTQVADEPVLRNSELGTYTNFMNLLDYSAVALPAGFLPSGAGWGITLFAEAFADRRLLSIAARYTGDLPFRPGVDLPARFGSKRAATAGSKTVDVVVCGAHLGGMPLNWQLTQRSGALVEATTTASGYRLFALADGRRPALVRDQGSTQAIAVEVWRLPMAYFGSFVAEIPAPLGIGKVQLADGQEVTGFIAEPCALEGAREITEMGSWRVYWGQR